MSDVQYRVDAGYSKQSMEQTNRLLKAASEIQLDFIRASNVHSWFEQTLQAFLDVTNSEYGFIGTVHHNAYRSPWLQPKVINKTVRKQPSAESEPSSMSEGLPFQNVGTLSDETLRTGELFISNVPVADRSLGDSLPGDPGMTAFM